MNKNFKVLFIICFILLFINSFKISLHYVYSQSKFNGELYIVTQSGTHNFKLQAVGMVWGKQENGYPVTHEWDYYETNGNSLNAEHCESPHQGNIHFAFGKYKLTIDNDDYIYVDYRDCDYEDDTLPHGTGYTNPDLRFWYSPDSGFFEDSDYKISINNGSKIVIWNSDNKNPPIQNTECFSPKVSIQGPGKLEPGEWGTFTANASGLNTPFSYQWYRRVECEDPYLKDNKDPKDTPCGKWYSFGSDTHIVQSRAWWDFSLKVVVTDNEDNTASDIHYISVNDNKLLKEPLEQNDRLENVQNENILLANIYPNPFNSQTTISFFLSKATLVSVILYNIKGQSVNTLIPYQEYNPGNHSVIWNGKNEFGENIASGIYLCKISINNQTKIIRTLLLR